LDSVVTKRMVTTPLCAAFQLLADRTWQRMAKTHTTGILLREDALTSINLQDLYHYKGPSFTFFDFTAMEESRESGADWEWHFVQPTGAFGAAVQAKSLVGGLYDIGYRPKKGPPQIERLLRYARRHGLSPHYCFYNYWDGPAAASPFWPCPSIDRHLPLWGCAIADGLAVWELHRAGSHSLTDILPVCLPWHCLVCCPGRFTPGRPPGPATRAHGIAQYLHERAAEAFRRSRRARQRPSTRVSPPSLRDQPPERIQRLLDAEAGLTRPPADLVLRLWDGQPPQFVVVMRAQEGEGEV
jgi:hypothetical protein